MRLSTLSLALLMVSCCFESFGCGAVYPELATPLRTPGAEQRVEPAPPPNLVWIAFKEAEAPEKTRDGRDWHELGSKGPNPFAILFVNGQELIRTHAESNSLHPTWSGSPRGNFRIPAGARFRVEMWDSGLPNRAICIKDLGSDTEEWLANRQVEIECDGGGRVVLAWEPAHARVGYGFLYEFRTFDVYLTRVYEESPAARAGVRPGDQITIVSGKKASDLSNGVIQSYLNASKLEGIALTVRHENKTIANVVIKEGAVYPLFSEVGSMP